MSSLAESIVRWQEAKANDRTVWESHWEEVAERVLPRQAGIFFLRNTTEQSRRAGEKRTEKAFDSTASIALERFSSVMESLLTPQHDKWHMLKHSNPDVSKNYRVRKWFETVNDVLWFERSRSQANHQSQQFERYMSLGAFGTGAMFIDAHDKGGLRYRNMHLSEVYFDVNHQGLIDVAYRRFSMTVRQMALRAKARGWQLPEQVRKQWEEKSGKEWDKEHEIIHCIRPRAERDASRIDSKNMEFASYWVHVDEKKIMHEGGFNSFPFSISRYVVAPGEMYGRGPAMMALPSIKVLNEEKKSMLKQGQRAADPVLLLHDDGIMDNVSLMPGAANWGGVSKEGRPLVQTLPSGNFAIAREMMEMERETIRDVFLLTIFEVLINRRGQTPPTATEVLELTKEKGALLAPTMGRQQSEALGPQIERELDLLAMQGRIPPMPPELEEAGADYEVQYDSPLSRAQRAEQAAGLFRTMEFAATMANATQDPSVFDHINIDAAMPALMDINAVPLSWQNTEEAIAEKRGARNEQAAQQQLIEAAPALAGTLKAVGG